MADITYHFDSDEEENDIDWDDYDFGEDEVGRVYDLDEDNNLVQK